jgi:hypothetical protein
MKHNVHSIVLTNLSNQISFLDTRSTTLYLVWIKDLDNMRHCWGQQRGRPWLAGNPGVEAASSWLRTDGEDEGVARFEDLWKPAVALEAQLHEAEALLCRLDAADEHRHRWAEVLHKLSRYAWIHGYALRHRLHPASNLMATPESEATIKEMELRIHVLHFPFGNSSTTSSHMHMPTTGFQMLNA